MKGNTLFWKCIWRLGILENNEHLLRFVNNIISIIELNKLGPLSRLIRNVNKLDKREVLGQMWKT
jgi:hypothetical protein